MTGKELNGRSWAVLPDEKGKVATEMFFFFIQFLYTITQGKHRAMLYISKGFNTEQKQNEYKHKLNNNVKKEDKIKQTLYIQ